MILFVFVLPPSEGIAFVIITIFEFSELRKEVSILNPIQHLQQAWTLYRSIMQGQVFDSQHPMRAFVVIHGEVISSQKVRSKLYPQKPYVPN